MREQLTGAPKRVGAVEGHHADALQRLVSAELTFYLELQAQVTDDLPQIIDGHIRLPDNTHLAAAIDWARVARFAI